MSDSSIEVNGGQLQDFTIDQFAGALALTLGSVGGLLMIIWKSRCMCKMNCCYLFQCERRPPVDNNDKDSDEEEARRPVEQAPVEQAPVEPEQIIPEQNNNLIDNQNNNIEP